MTGGSRTSRVAVFAIVLATTTPWLASCHTTHRRGHATLSLRSVPVPVTDPCVDAILPDDFRLEEGDVVRRQSFSLHADGSFTLTRTIEREVGAIGAQARSLTPSETEARGLEPSEGVILRVIRRRSPAERAGLRVGDVVLGYSGEAIRSAEQFRHLVETSRPGGEVEVELLKDGDPVALRLEVGSQTEIVETRAYRRQLEVLDDMDRTGMRILQIPPDLSPIILRPGGGVTRAGDGREIVEGGSVSGPHLMIAEILPGGPAFYSDLRLRDTLLAVDEAPVRTLEEYSAALAAHEAGDRIGVTSRRGHEIVATHVGVERDARARSGFNLLGLLEYRSEPAATHFSLIWSLVFNYHSNRYVHETDGAVRHEQDTSWGLVLNLLAYDGTPRRKRFVIAWILPIWFGG